MFLSSVSHDFHAIVTGAAVLTLAACCLQEKIKWQPPPEPEDMDKEEDEVEASHAVSRMAVSSCLQDLESYRPACSTFTGS